ncbi:MAG: M23 family metallopeptidase [Flavobacteriales bacterium]|nr:M23 family metallopeptidase [Flavobacteriales bacterium]
MGKRKAILGLLTIVLVGLVLPHPKGNPVAGADNNSYNARSFWYYPWGHSGTHKGVDVFAPIGTDVKSTTGGLVLYTGQLAMGGNMVLVIGPKWRLHYFAHLHTINTSSFRWCAAGSIIGTVGDSGNAKGKPPHLHYSIVTLIPFPWRMDGAPQGWKKMFYLDPTPYLAH